MNAREYDVLIAGAGPAGTAAALALRHSGLRVALFDKAAFPRDKVCGDAIGGRIPEALRALDPAYEARFLAFAHKTHIHGCRLVSPNLNHIDVTFSKGGFTATRVDFDQFLFDLAKEESKAEIFQNVTIKDAHQAGEGIVLETSQGTFSGRVLIACDGANSVAARQLAGLQVDPDHHCGAVRAYYQGVTFPKENTLEVYFLKGYLPGYFWIFPLENGLANVGFGMLTRTISERKINLKQSIEAILEEFPSLKERFIKAELVGKITGFGLPLGSKKRTISGNRFLLVGDAAGLIDPFTGEGIGNAMISARLAAERVVEAFEKQDFSAEFFQQYDQKVYEKLWKTFRTSHLFQRLLGGRIWLINFLLGTAARNRFFKRWLHKVM
ncbi:MAG: geranylgeranyl reductase family protein [Bacteroidia bacterium]|nr:geranylgeranyl reductase family protein [Bacteroidia bacterium]